MLKFFMSKRGDNTLGLKLGFTLIELLVVIAIIGVLASIVLASLNTARRKSRDARRVTDLKQLQLALELFYDGQTTPAYPASTANCSVADPRGLQALAPTYIPTIPHDPNAGAPNCYAYATIAAPILAYHLGALLEAPITDALFTGDRDCNSGVAGGATGCGATIYNNQFSGIDSAANPMYDVTP